MRRNYFENAINITERLGIKNNNQRLRENNNISFVNINSGSNVLNNSLNYQIQLPNMAQINKNMIGQKQNNIINPNEKNKSPIINKRNNAMENINNNFNNNINKSVNYNGSNKINNNVNNNVSNVNNRAGNNGNNKNGKQIQNNFLYLSSYFNINNDLRRSQSNRTSLSEPIKNNENNPIPKKEEGETKKLIKTMTDLINVIKKERVDIKAQTEQLYAQNEHLYSQNEHLSAQTNQLKVQTDAIINQLMADRNESRKQHEQLVQLLLQNMNKNNNDAKQ